MKKVSIIQIIAGILLMVSWFVYLYLVEPGYYEMEILDIDGNLIAHFGIFSLKTVRPVMVIWLAGYPICAILVTGCGISRLLKNIRELKTMKLDIAQIIFGAFLLALMIIFVTSYEPHWQNYASDFPLNFPGAVEIRHNPGWVALMNTWKIGSFLLGPMIAGPAMWQIVKSKNEG
jgi:hypothetical protein